MVCKMHLSLLSNFTFLQSSDGCSVFIVVILDKLLYMHKPLYRILILHQFLLQAYS